MKCPKCGKDLVEIDAGYGITQTYVLACKNENCEFSKRGIKIPVIYEIAEQLQSALARVKGITEEQVADIVGKYFNDLVEFKLNDDGEHIDIRNVSYFADKTAQAIYQLISDKIDGR